MLKMRSTSLTVAVMAAVAIIAVVGSVAIASNMGFKLNKAIVFFPTSTSQIGNNWTSIPYNNPYGNVGAFCTQTGLISTGLTRTSIVVLNENTGVPTTVSCGSTAATSLILIPGKGLQIRQPNLAGALSSIIIVGSHNPTLSITLPKAIGAVGSYWFSVPYHTTAVSANDLCLSSGLTSTGLTRAQLVRMNAVTGLPTTVSCGSTAAAALSLVLGEFVQLREPFGPKTFIPAHF